MVYRPEPNPQGAEAEVQGIWDLWVGSPLAILFVIIWPSFFKTVAYSNSRPMSRFAHQGYG